MDESDRGESDSDDYKPFLNACQQQDVKKVAMILSEGGNANERFSRGRRPLHIAAWYHNTDLAKLLLNKGADPDASDYDNVTPLHRAVELENEAFIKLLINHGADVNRDDIESRTLLHIAVHKDNKDIVRLLLKNGADPNKVNLSRRYFLFNWARPVLITAAAKDSVKMVELLINYGADVNAKDRFGRTAIFYAIATVNVSMFKLLLRNGADVKSDADLLNFAVYMDCEGIVKILLDSGIDINSADSRGKTAFPYVATKEDSHFKIPKCDWLITRNHNLMRMRTAKVLLRRGIDVNLRDTFQLTSLHWAAAHGYVQFVKTLFEYNPDVNAQDRLGRTALHLSTDAIISRTLLRNGADVKIANERGETPLHAAAKMGDTKIIETLLQFNANINAQDKYHRTPLHLSTNEIVSHLLLKNGANPNLASKSGETALHVAVQKGHVKTVEALLKFKPDINALDEEDRTALHRSTNVIISQMLLRHGADVNVANKRGETPLHVAVQMGNNEIAEVLLNFKPDVNARDKLQRTPLHFSQNEGITWMLLRNGVNVNVASQSGETPLHVAVKMGNNEIAEALLNFKPDVNARDKLQRTPLHFFQNEDIIWMLLRNGVNVNVASQSGETPLHIAARKGQVEIAEVLLAFSADPNVQDEDKVTPLHQSTKAFITRMLLQKGADVNACNCRGDTPLHVAAHRGYTKIAKILLEYKADVDYKNDRNATPLHHSVQSRKVDISEMLLKGGAAVNAKYKDGKTPLHIAATKGDAELVTLLLNYGADINCPDRGGKTPIFYAIQPERFPIFKILLDHDPDINIRVTDHMYAAVKCTMLEWIVSVDRNYGELETFCEAVEQHILKVKALNRFVSDNNLKAIDNDVEWVSDFYICLKEEVGKMRLHKIGNTNVSAYDLLTKNFTRIAMYIIFKREASDFEASRSTITEALFPLYYGMIVCKLEKVKRKAIAWIHSEKCLDKILAQWLPVDVTEIVFSYLEDEDLRNLSQMYIEYEKIQENEN